MSKATNTATTRTFAEEGLEEVQQEAANAPTETPTTYNNTSGESDEFVQVGGLEPVAFFYRTNAPKKPTKSPFKVIEKGQTIIGTYERSFISGKFGNPTFLVRLSDKTLVGLPGAGSLTKAMSKLAEGSKVKIVYNGMQPIKSGQWEGSDAHLFTVFGSKLKAV
jgi:hypothetical protein